MFRWKSPPIIRARTRMADKLFEDWDPYLLNCPVASLNGYKGSLRFYCGITCHLNNVRQGVWISTTVRNPAAIRKLHDQKSVSYLVWTPFCSPFCDDHTAVQAVLLTRRCLQLAGNGTETSRVFLKYTRVTSPKLAKHGVIGQRWVTSRNSNRLTREGNLMNLIDRSRSHAPLAAPFEQVLSSNWLGS
ncbi:hypothetical protein Bbelb_141910 [Branchiostoma belcheri]|nr:hypothetical protein Bbelb_141910 [Branchiostoma belcheri]